jgi:uncharacterized protein YjiS (DUF1127 family)
MAYVNSSRSRSGLADRLAAYLADVREAARRYRVYRRTLAELNSMSDRDLADIGLYRGQIEDVAAEAARQS